MNQIEILKPKNMIREVGGKNLIGLNIRMDRTEKIVNLNVEK